MALEQVEKWCPKSHIKSQNQPIYTTFLTVQMQPKFSTVVCCISIKYLIKLQELFKKTCTAATEKLGSCVFLMDNAAYHCRLQNEQCRISYWTALPAADVKRAWENCEVCN